jgi:hypothetical protein
VELLQEDKEPLFDSMETIQTVLEVTAEFAQNVTYNKERIARSLPAGYLDATTLADYLVYKVLNFLLIVMANKCFFFNNCTDFCCDCFGLAKLT